MDPKQNPGYVDATYLQSAESLLHLWKGRSYEMMQIEKGHHIIDVGCGPASDTIPIAQLVGASGRVVGVDYDAEMIDIANQKAQDAGISEYVTHEQADAGKLPFDDNSFDSCHNERVLQHLPNPEVALAEMVRVTKPGGYVHIVDTDWTTVSIDSPYPEIGIKLNQIWSTHSNNPPSGRQLYRQLKQAGLISVIVEPIVLPFTDYQFFNLVVENEIRVNQAIERGLLTQAEGDMFVAHLQEQDAKGLFYAYFVYVLAVGQKPT